MVKLFLERFPKAKRSKSKLTLQLSLFFVVSVLKKSKCLITETGFVIVAVNLLFRVSFSPRGGGGKLLPIHSLKCKHF